MPREFKKRKKFTNRAYDIKQAQICDRLIEINYGAFFVISKKFIQEKEGSLWRDLTLDGKNRITIIISSVPIENLFIPSTYHLTEDNFLTNWDGDVVLAKLVHYPMWFKDGEIKGKKYDDLYFYIEEPSSEDEVKLRLKKR